MLDLRVEIETQNRRFKSRVHGRPLYIFDLDGTLADLSHRKHLIEEYDPPMWDEFFDECDADRPNAPVIVLLDTLRDSGAEIWVFSGRTDRVRGKTLTWLAMYAGFDGGEAGSPWLMMREEGDRTPDHVLKKQWLDAMLPEDRARLVCVFDDRDAVVAMWRENGVPCLQVAPGGF